MSKSAARRRFRVVARRKEQVRRIRALAAVAVLAAMGVVAFVTVRKLAADFQNPLSFSGPSVSAAVVEGPEPLRTLAQATVDATAGSIGEKAEALKARFSSLSDVRVRRSWTEKTATLTLIVRRPIAAATRRGKPAGFIGDDGVLFEAPQGAFILTGPTVEVADASRAELSALAREWSVLSGADAFPSALTSMAYASPENGWEARLTDGTKVQWGRLEWTREKLTRLSEAMADARLKAPGAFSADLRWFEDGKVLLKPYQTNPALARVGKTR